MAVIMLLSDVYFFSFSVDSENILLVCYENDLYDLLIMLIALSVPYSLL